MPSIDSSQPPELLACLRSAVAPVVGDIRLKAPDVCFSIVTIYNTIYYFE
jgi:hypothetical protein